MTESIPIKLNKKPDISILQVEQFLNKNWKFIERVKLRELVSYDSRTYLVELNAQHQQKYIFKISNVIESRDVRYFDCISLILQHLESNNIFAQKLIRSTDGKLILDFYEKGNTEVYPLKSCLLSYIEGELILNRAIDKDICFLTARELSRLTRCVDQICSNLSYLVEFSKDSIWNIKNASLIQHIIPHFDCEHKRLLLKLTLEKFEEIVLPNMDKLTRGFIHGDPNDMNILITEDKKICFIDWQDCTLSIKAYDLSILIFSLMSISIDTPGSLDLLSIGKYCLLGYITDNHSSFNQTDIDLLPIIVQTRIALSLCIGYYTNKYLDPTNEYLLHTQKTGWKLLEDLMNNHTEYSQKWKC